MISVNSSFTEEELNEINELEFMQPIAHQQQEEEEEQGNDDSNSVDFTNHGAVEVASSSLARVSRRALPPLIIISSDEDVSHEEHADHDQDISSTPGGAPVEHCDSSSKCAYHRNR